MSWKESSLRLFQRGSLKKGITDKAAMTISIFESRRWRWYDWGILRLTRAFTSGLDGSLGTKRRQSQILRRDLALFIIVAVFVAILLAQGLGYL